MTFSNGQGNFRIPSRASFALVCGLALTASHAWGQDPATAPTPAPVDTAAANAALSAPLTAFAAKFDADNKLKLVLIPAGQFTMSGGRAHLVTISHPFLMGATDVTQAQWTAVTGDNPSHFKDDNRPVERVTYEEVLKFDKKLTEREQAAGRLPSGYIFTLPTEAQWEYACRAGTTGDYAGDIAEMGWYDTTADMTTHPVGLKKPNAWGLYDMHGNVWQWVADWYGTIPGGPATDPTGPATGSNRVWRGGSWEEGSEYCKSSSRVGDDHNSRFPNLGFRLALVPVPVPPAPPAPAAPAEPAPAKAAAATARTIALKVAHVDSQETNAEDGKGANAVDGDPDTFWHTEYQDVLAPYPHEIVIELNPPALIKGFTYLPRQDGNQNGTIKDYEFYVSDDGVNFGQPVTKGSFENNSNLKTVTIDPKPTRFFKLRALSEVNGGAWASAAEIGVVPAADAPKL